MDYKATLNLPKTAFPMKANLPESEPKMLAWWEQFGMYKRLRQVAADRPLWIPQRRPAVPDRQHPCGARPKKSAKRRHGKVGRDARFQRGLRPGGGLSGLADRASGGQGAGPRRPRRRHTARNGSR